MRTIWTVVAAAAACLALAGGFTWYVWHAMGDVAISTHGLIALGLGVGLTFLLGVGLMMLVYFSHKRGYDDDAGHE